MRRLALAALLVGVLGGVIVQAQTYQLQVTGQHLSGTDFIFDIYLLRTGSDPLYLGNSDFALTFDNTNFSSPAVSVLASDAALTSYYEVSASIVEGNRCIVNVTPGFPSTLVKWLDVSSSSSGSLIATVSLSGVVNGEGTSGLAWRNSGDNHTIVTSITPVSPYTQVNVTDAANHIPPEQALPVTLISFSGAMSAVQGGVLLEWKTASEVDNSGYTVQRKSGGETSFTDVAGSFIPGNGTTTEAHQYNFVDKSITKAGAYSYRLKQQDLDGAIHYSESILIDVTVTDVAETAPLTFGLMQNWPNPFNPTTTIRYTIAGVVALSGAFSSGVEGPAVSGQQSADSRVRLVVFDLLGRQVAVLVNEKKEPGTYAATWNAAGMASGTYVCRLTAGDKTDVRRMLLLR